MASKKKFQDRSKLLYQDPAQLTYQSGAPTSGKADGPLLVSQMKVGTTLQVERTAVKIEFTKVPTNVKRGDKHRVVCGTVNGNAKAFMAGDISIKRLSTTQYLVVSYKPKHKPAPNDKEGMAKYRRTQLCIQGHVVLTLAVSATS